MITWSGTSGDFITLPAGTDEWGTNGISYDISGASDGTQWLNAGLTQFIFWLDTSLSMNFSDQKIATVDIDTNGSLRINEMGIADSVCVESLLKIIVSSI